MDEETGMRKRNECNEMNRQREPEHGDGRRLLQLRNSESRLEMGAILKKSRCVRRQSLGS